MGKGYNNYMCKKPFHPGSKANIKRAWMAEQKTENDKRKQEELKLQYDKEQEVYSNRALLSKDSKEKLGLNFMYEAPPGAKKEHQKEDNDPEYKFEWQRKYNAPREDFARGNAEIRDQPFGIQVRNVRCIKCHKWGHINTDKECPLFNKAGGLGDVQTAMDPVELMRRMKEEEGLALKQSILGRLVDSTLPNQQMISSEEEEDVEMQFLKSLSTKQKQKLLRKLEKYDQVNDKQKSKKSLKRKKSKKDKSRSKRRRKQDSSESDTDSDSSRSQRTAGRDEHRRRKRRLSSSRRRERSPDVSRARSPQQQQHKKRNRDDLPDPYKQHKRRRHDTSSDSSDDEQRHYKSDGRNSKRRDRS